MLNNLKKEIYDAKITQRRIALACGITERAVQDKLMGKYDFKSEEMFAIQRAFFPNKTLEYLFKKETTND